MSTKDHPLRFEKPHLPLELNGEEVNYLSGTVCGHDVDFEYQSQDPDVYTPLFRKVILLLGGAFNELVPDPPVPPLDRTVTLVVDEDVVWLLRAKTKATAIATDKVTNLGVPLLHKLYSLLLRFNSELVDVAEAVDYDEPAMTPEMAEQLREHLNASRSTD